MRTLYCIPSLKKIKPYDLKIEKVNYPKYKKSRTIRVSGGEEALYNVYLTAVNLEKEEVKGCDSIKLDLTDGEYRIKNTVVLNQKAKSGLPIIFSSENKAALYASIKVSGGWQPYKGGIYKTHVSAEAFRQLYVDSKPAVRARFPKKNDDCNKEVFEGKWLDKTKQIFLPSEFENSMRDFDSECIEVHIIEAWTHSVIKPDGYERLKNGFAVNLSPICRERFYEPRSSKIAKPKVWLENSLSLLTEPNEWFYDEKKQTLYYYPEKGSDINSLTFEIPQAETIFEIENSGNICFENLEFAYTNWNSPSKIGYVDGQGVSRLDTIDGITAWRTPPALINVKNSNKVSLVNCDMHGTGAMGIKYDGECDNVFVWRNRFYDIGAGAVSAGSFIVEEPFKSAVSKGVTVSDNVIKNFGMSYLSGVGILIGYSQNVRVDHNDVSYGSYTGISIGWGWGLETPMKDCKIRNNRVTHIIENHLYDGSGLYILGRHLDSKQNIVSGNYLEGGHGYAGLYFDEKANGYIARNNYIGRGRKWFLLMHDIDYGLHDIAVEDNFIEITRRYINSYSPGKKYKPKTKKSRNVIVKNNFTRIHPKWEENKERIFNYSGVRKY